MGYLWSRNLVGAIQICSNKIPLESIENALILRSRKSSCRAKWLFLRHIRPLILGNMHINLALEVDIKPRYCLHACYCALLHACRPGDTKHEKGLPPKNSRHITSGCFSNCVLQSQMKKAVLYIEAFNGFAASKSEHFLKLWPKLTSSSSLPETMRHFLRKFMFFDNVFCPAHIHFWRNPCHLIRISLCVWSGVVSLFLKLKHHAQSLQKRPYLMPRSQWPFLDKGESAPGLLRFMTTKWDRRRNAIIHNRRKREIIKNYQ